ncbi:MAG: hypothetical protein RIC52_03905 [Amphiplicatus sp.]
MRNYRKRRESAQRAMRAAAFLIAMFGVLWSGAAIAEPACADAALGFVADDDHENRHLVGSFRLAGADISLIAIGRAAYADTQMTRDAIEEAQEMGKFMPGYPQPAHVTVSLSVSF